MSLQLDDVSSPGKCRKTILRGAPTKVEGPVLGVGVTTRRRTRRGVLSLRGDEPYNICGPLQPISRSLTYFLTYSFSSHWYQSSTPNVFSFTLFGPFITPDSFFFFTPTELHFSKDILNVTSGGSGDGRLWKSGRWGGSLWVEG